MSFQSVKGVYKDGRVELSEEPEAIKAPSEVIVIFLQPAADSAVKKAAIERMLKRMDSGMNLGGGPYPTREEIYEERTKRITDGLN